MEHLQYPIGKFDWTASMSTASRHDAIDAIRTLPARLRTAVSGLTRSQLDTPYRPGGWTVAQVVHHLGDSHLNGFARFKFALTEDNPDVRPYDEKKWSALADSALDPDITVQLLQALHARWTALLEAMSGGDFARLLTHRQYGVQSLDRFTHLYGWHSNHHLAHITELRRRDGW